MRIALVGASGFVGGHVAEALAARGTEFLAVRAPRVRQLWGEPNDVAIDSPALTDIVSQLAVTFSGCSVVINVAGLADPGSGSEHALIGANAVMPTLLARAAKQAGVRRFVHVSSAAVQGRRQVLDSSPHTAPISVYSRSKAAGERGVLREGPPETVVYRPAGVHACGRSVTASLGSLARSPASSVAAPGDANAPHALAANVGDAIAYLATVADAPPQIVHHPSEGISTGELLNFLGGRQPRIVPMPIASAVSRIAAGMGRVHPKVAAYARRLDVLWFGQEQAPSWLTEAGWTPRLQSQAWHELGRQLSHRPARQDLHVVHVFSVMNRGGAESRTVEVVRELAGLPVHFTFVTLSGRDGDFDGELQSLGARVQPCRLGWTFPVSLFRLLRSIRPDVVHSHLATFSGVPLAVAAIAGVPVRIAHFRSDGDAHGNSPLRLVLRSLKRRLVDLAATDILGVSPGALTYGWSSDWENDTRCQVVPNGLQLRPLLADKQRMALRASLALDREALVIAHVGRATPEKNRPRALHIFAELAARMPGAQLLFVGQISPAEQRALSTLIRDRCLEGRVHLLGVREDVRDLLAASDVCLVTSTREGLPGVVLESLAEGTPVVSSRLPGTEFIARFSGRDLRLLGHDEQDAAWVASLCELTKSREAESRALVRGRFESSPFLVQDAAERLMRTWSRRGTDA